MAGVRGAIGKQVVFRHRGGKVIVSAYPYMGDRVLSPKQLKVNEVMAEANDYAKTIIENEQKRQEAQIRLDLPSNRLYTALVREYFKENYKKEEQGVAVQKPTEPLNEAFVNYLLDNSDKTVEEIAMLTNSSPEIIAEYKERRNK